MDSALAAREDIRLRLEQYLGQPLRPATWQYLVDEGKIEPVVRGERDLNWLSGEVHKFWDAAGQRGTAPSPVRLLTREQRARARHRDEVLSILFAHEADKHKGVADFRREVLKGRLLEPEQIDLWFVQQRAADGAATEWLTQVPVPPGYRVTQVADGGFITKPPLKINKATAARGIRVEKVEYAVNGPSWSGIGGIFTSAGGVLERLRQLSVELEEMFGWSQAEATTYVLAGEVPYVPSVRLIPFEKYPGGPLRIAMDIDLALTPRQLADIYRRIRRAKLGIRLRALSPKHLGLAGFIIQRPGEEPWLDRLRAWNRVHPEWKYENEVYFKRDSVMARRRLLASAVGPEVEPQNQRRRPPVEDGSEEMIRDIFAAALQGTKDGLAERGKRDRRSKRGGHRISRSPERMHESSNRRRTAKR